MAAAMAVFLRLFFLKMKTYILFIGFLFFAAVMKAQIVVPDYQASTGGIGPFRVGLSRAATEKLLNLKLKLPHASGNDSYDIDTVLCNYKEMKLQLVFSRSYFGNDTAMKLGIFSVTSSYPQLKTKSGVGIGDDKLKIVKTYELYRLDIAPEWTAGGKPNPNRSTVTLYDNESPKVLIFHLDNNIVTAISATQYEGD